MTSLSRPFVHCACAALLFFACVGCSTLGFSPYPVAHTLTNDTKAVLESTPRLVDVPRERSKVVQREHHLQPGDELLIEPIESEIDVEIPADQRVMADGSLDLGKCGRVVVASMTLEETESLIQQRVAEVYEEEIVINVRLIQGVHRYYVIGEVNSPGAFPLTGHETVLDAIMEAGGLTNRASACDILLARPTEPCSCRVTLPVCYRAITQLGDTTTNYHLKPGDRIFVARQSFCEEMTAYMLAARSCPRCEKCQVACRDPQSAEPVQPEFAMPPVLTVAAPMPPKIPATQGNPANDSETIPHASDEPWSSDSAGEESIGLELEPVNDATQPQGLEPPPKNLLDGELDFDAFLRRAAPAADRQE